MIHYLQQQIKYIRVSFFYLVQQQYGMRIFGDCFGQQSTLVKTDIARRRADQAGHSMALHILRHIETDQLYTQDHRQLPGDLGFANTRRPGKQEGTDRFLFVAKTRAGHLDGARQCFDSFVLAVDHHFQITLQSAQ